MTLFVKFLHCLIHQVYVPAEVLTQLIQDCIGLLHAEHLNVLALVFDGTFGNQSTAVQLGCKMSVSDMQTWFPHPQDDKL